jgi:hypothetical protein
MRKYAFINRILISFCLLAIYGCNDKFILDPIDPRLPIYSETGNNTAGALINEQVWKTESTSIFFPSYQPYFTAFSNVDSINITFSGKSEIYGAIEFNLTGLHIYKFEDLVNLDNKKVQLDGLNNYGKCMHNQYYPVDDDKSMARGIGQIYFKHMVMNDSLNITASGTFGFVFQDETGANIEVSYGRFDYKIEKMDNFHVLESWSYYKQ